MSKQYGIAMATICILLLFVLLLPIYAVGAYTLSLDKEVYEFGDNMLLRGRATTPNANFRIDVLYGDMIMASQSGSTERDSHAYEITMAVPYSWTVGQWYALRVGTQGSYATRWFTIGYPVDAVTITNEEMFDDVITGDVIQLEYAVLPTYSTDTTAVFESSDPRLATVDEDGNVSFLRRGTVTLLVRARSGAEERLTVVVSDPPRQRSSNRAPSAPTVQVCGSRVSVGAPGDTYAALTLTTEETTSYLAEREVFEVRAGALSPFALTLPLSALQGSRLMITTNHGSVQVPARALLEIRDVYGEPLTVRMSGSAGLALELSVNGQIVHHLDPRNPLELAINYKLERGEKASGVVAFDQANGTLIPTGAYLRNTLLLKTAYPGSYRAVFNGKVFVDIEKHWAAESIEFMAARNLMSGVGDSRFSPDDRLTRAMLTAVLANIEGAKPTTATGHLFTDVSPRQWFAPAVEWAAGRGIVSGMNDGTFAPNAHVTREQMAVMLLAYLKAGDASIPTPDDRSRFEDWRAVSEWAAEAVAVMRETGLMAGRNGNYFGPREFTSRAEAATVLARLVRFLGGV